MLSNFASAVTPPAFSMSSFLSMSFLGWGQPHVAEWLLLIIREHQARGANPLLAPLECKAGLDKRT